MGWFVVLSIRAIWGLAEKRTVVLEEYSCSCVYICLSKCKSIVSFPLEILPALIAKKTPTYLA